jgi:hypothetical protein
MFLENQNFINLKIKMTLTSKFILNNIDGPKCQTLYDYLIEGYNQNYTCNTNFPNSKFAICSSTKLIRRIIIIMNIQMLNVE